MEHDILRAVWWRSVPAFAGTSGIRVRRLLLHAEIARVRRRLILAGRHQVAVGTQEIEFLADDDVIVVFATLEFVPQDIALAVEGLHYHPGPGQRIVDCRDLVAQDVATGLVEGDAFLD